MMLILKSFHKSFYLDDSLAAVQLFRKHIVPFPVRQSKRLKLRISGLQSRLLRWFSPAAIKRPAVTHIIMISMSAA